MQIQTHMYWISQVTARLFILPDSAVQQHLLKRHLVCWTSFHVKQRKEAKRRWRNLGMFCPWKCWYNCRINYENSCSFSLFCFTKQLITSTLLAELATSTERAVYFEQLLGNIIHFINAAAFGVCQYNAEILLLLLPSHEKYKLNMLLNVQWQHIFYLTTLQHLLLLFIRWLQQLNPRKAFFRRLHLVKVRERQTWDMMSLLSVSQSAFVDWKTNYMQDRI